MRPYLLVIVLRGQEFFILSKCEMNQRELDYLLPSLDLSVHLYILVYRTNTYHFVRFDVHCYSTYTTDINLIPHTL